jgi:hypothetical protein
MVLRVIAWIVVCVLWRSPGHSQEVRNIPLKPEMLSYAMKNFYILRVKDVRADTNNIGVALVGGQARKNLRLNLVNGVQDALTKFLHEHLQQDTNTSPMELRVTNFKVEPKGRSGLKAENALTIRLALFQDGINLIEYTGGGNSESTGDATKPIEELIRGTIANILEQLDAWWANNKSFYNAQKTKPGFRVEVSMDEESEDSNFVAYALNRPLTLDDFRGPPQTKGDAVAVTFSMLSVKYASIQTASNEVIVDVSVLTNFSKSRSWCRMENRNAETLAHEQRHFDISAIKACELVDTLRHFHFTTGNFTVELFRIQRQKQNELDLLQNQYDQESKHGVGGEAQEKWNRMIKEKLLKSGCYHS